MTAIRVGAPEFGLFCVIFTFCGMVAAQTVKIPHQIPSPGPYGHSHSLCSGLEVNFLDEKQKIQPSYDSFPRFFRFFAYFHEFQRKRLISVNAAVFPRSRKVPMSELNLVQLPFPRIFIPEFIKQGPGVTFKSQYNVQTCSTGQYKYNQNCASGHLCIAATCLQRSPQFLPLQSFFHFNCPLYRGHLAPYN